MSYILEALRRAQNERERGQVPGLNAQPASSPAEAAPRAGAAVPWPVLAAVVVALLVGLGAWWWRSVAPAAPPMAAVPVVVAPPAPLSPAPATLPVVVSAPVVPAPSVQASAAAPLPNVVAAPAALPASRAAPRALALSELTADQRRDLPPLVMGGSIWSESTLGRFVIVNGQVVREGELAAPGVTVERIAPKAVLLRWRDLRFEVPL